MSLNCKKYLGVTQVYIYIYNICQKQEKKKLKHQQQTAEKICQLASHLKKTSARIGKCSMGPNVNQQQCDNLGYFKY